MKISLIFRIAAIALVVTLAACSSSQTTSGNSTSSNTSSNSSTDRSGANERGGVDMTAAISSLPAYSPGGNGFAYKSTYVNPAEFNSWVSQFKPQIQSALNAMAPGYKLQITGHSCAIGPREAEGGRMGNIYYSEQRAKAVYQALINAGLPADKMIVKGIANDEPLPGVDPKDQKNRRVTFKIVQG